MNLYLDGRVIIYIYMYGNRNMWEGYIEEESGKEDGMGLKWKE